MASRSLALVRWIVGLGAGVALLAACSASPSGGADPTIASPARAESPGPESVIRGPACGSAGQSCCASHTCVAWASCSPLLENPSAYECFACGGEAQPVCPTGAPCQTGLNESYGFCTNDCGGMGQGCCSGTSCNSGAVCNAHKECAPAPPIVPPPCGNYNEPCCSNGCLNGFLECVAGYCSVLCGFAEAPCCAGDACYDGSSCQAQICR